jgi:diacylglycerol kinase (ATP)
MFQYAFSGLSSFIMNERNARIHFFAAAVAILLGLYVELKSTEWLWIALAICLVFAAELFNSALEKLADRISQERDPRIKAAKDMAAASVLICSIFALVVGIIIFAPKLL